MLNWVDLLIILLLAGSVYVAVKIGLYRLLFVIVGFFGAMFFGGYVFPHLLPIKDDTLKFIINCNLVLLFSIFGGVKGFDIGHKLKKSIKHPKHHAYESWLGGLLGCAAMLIVVWLLAVVVGRMPFAGLSNSANDALIVQKLDETLPPVPAIFARLDMLIDPNAQPKVFKGHQPRPALISRGLSLELAMVANDKSDSVVRLTGFGCGGIVTGTGFVVAPNLIATNAHVVAGVKRPIIKSEYESYVGEPVVFNAGADVAILRTKGFKAQPFEISDTLLQPKSRLAMVGYPNGNFTVREAEVISLDDILVSNIYGIGDFGRKVYYFRADVRDGNSGGPIIGSDGKVAGMVFARVDGKSGAGYALISDKLTPLISQAKKTNRKVSTGACLR